jgi:hypothetical protein
MASSRKIGRNWFYRVVDANGVQRERKGCPDGRWRTGSAALPPPDAKSRFLCGYVEPTRL